MRLKVIVSVSLVMLMSVAWAEKPEWAGKGKPTAEQKEAHKAAMKAKRAEQTLEDRGEADEEEFKPEKVKKEKMKKHKDKLDAEGRAALRADDSDEAAPDRAEKERKEAAKGSDKGQQSREEHSRKWWQFWGED